MSMSSRNAVSVTERERRLAARTEQWLVGKVEDYLDKQRFSANPQWPYEFNVKQPSKSELIRDSDTCIAQARAIRSWAQSHGCRYGEKSRSLGAYCGTTPLVTRVCVPGEHEALEIAGRQCAHRYRATRQRFSCLRGEFDVSEDVLAAVVYKLKDMDDLDFELVCQAAHYFARHDASGMRPRAVAIPGFSAKWLGGKGSVRRKAICLLLGRESLDFEERPGEIRLRYLDSAHCCYPDLYVTQPWRTADCARFRYAVIVENKDTYQEMPQIDDCICVFDCGRAANRMVSLLPWLADTPHVVYWGDMDADGLEILSGIRESGIDCDSILMNMDVYRRYRRFGTEYTEQGRRIEPRKVGAMPGLRAEERELYEALCTGEGVGYLRIEQERIPIVDAVAELCAAGFPIVV